jgi:hypothetical protein
MSFTLSDFHDLVRVVEEHPEWRVELRRLVLTDSLLALPEQVAELRVQPIAASKSWPLLNNALTSCSPL